MKKIFFFFWRIWFYFLVFILTFTLSPLLFFLLLKSKWYHQLYFVGRNFWAIPILYGMGLFPSVKKHFNFNKNQSYILIANHTSMMDIMLMFYLCPNPFVFVGKKELAKLPLFGYFYKRIAILVDRNNSESKQAVYRQAHERIQNGLSICIFPEGGVPKQNTPLASFKDGAFRLAIEHQIPIATMVFHDCKKRFAYHSMQVSLGKLRATLLAVFPTLHLKQEDRSQLKLQIHQAMLTEIILSEKSPK